MHGSHKSGHGQGDSETGRQADVGSKEAREEQRKQRVTKLTNKRDSPTY